MPRNGFVQSRDRRTCLVPLPDIIDRSDDGRYGRMGLNRPPTMTVRGVTLSDGRTMVRYDDATGAAAARNVSLDVGRYLLLAGVIALHLLGAVPADRLGLWTVAVQNLSHVAVPVFLVTAGYFLSWRTRSYRRCIIQPLDRLLPLHLFWLGIYIVHYCVTVRLGWDWGPQIVMNGGPAYHLWFLPALLVALIVVGWRTRRWACAARCWSARCRR
jgi:hypothetical protein